MDSNNYKAAVGIENKKPAILLKSIIIGIAAGLFITLYRFALNLAEQLCVAAHSYAGRHPHMLPLWIAILALLGLATGFMVSRNDMITGSGIPQVKGIMAGYFKDSWLKTLLMKFAGGALAVGSGLSLGREGPSVQMGACIAEGIGGKAGSSKFEKKVLMASGAGAGLSAAFGAPLAGAVFALEEIFKYFSPVILLSTMVSAVSAQFAAALFFPEPVFNFAVTAKVPFDKYWIIALMALFLGFAGAFYNLVLVNVQKWYKKRKWLNAKTRPVIPFVCAGIIGITFPAALCSGHLIMDKLALSAGFAFLLTLLAVKFCFSVISFASGAPGGIFFPLLVTGASIGAVFGAAAVGFLGLPAELFYNFVILAMAGFFTAIVRAPITGIILLVEMTGSFSELLPIAIVTVTAFFVADVLKSPPVYDSLLYNMAISKKMEKFKGDPDGKTTIEVLACHGCEADGKMLKELKFPKNCLLISVKRNGRDFIPDGQTEITANDYLVFITSLKSETRVRRRLNRLIMRK